MTENLYYYQQSWGIGTNLQLHSLRQAWRLWQGLLSKKDKLRPGRIRERCVVIVDLLGLSLAQLLGQNVSCASKKVDSPRSLMQTFLNRTGVPLECRNDILKRFLEFMDVYDACRHFGIPKHETIDKLTPETTGDFVELAVDIWDIVCNHFRSKHEASLSFSSIREILGANEDDEDIDEWGTDT